MMQKEYGVELVQDVWCVFKIENNYTLWLDQKKQWTRETQMRAGIKEYEKAREILTKVHKGEI